MIAIKRICIAELALLLPIVAGMLFFAAPVLTQSLARTSSLFATSALKTCPLRPLTTMATPSPAVSSRPKNVLGTELACCCLSPRTGFFRDGFCETGPTDKGRHTVCAIVTADFLAYSASRGNDLRTPSPGNRFPGLKPGDKWCLCVSRWKEALDAGVAPAVVLEATHANALDVVKIEDLRKFAVSPEE